MSESPQETVLSAEPSAPPQGSSAPPTEPIALPALDAPDDSGLRKRQARRLHTRQPGARGSSGILKILLLWGTVSLVILTILGLIATPVVYRSLEPRYQVQIKHYLPFMSVFDRQRAYTADTLPTVAPAGNDGPSAADLLLTPEVIMPAVVTDASPTPNADSVIIITAVPTETPLATATATPMATEVQSTDIPATAVVLATTAAPPTPLPVTPAAVALLPSARLFGVEHTFQTWNNCGPATLTMALSYYGWTDDQVVAANVLKPDAEDKNVSPSQMVHFVNNNTGVRALLRMGGDLDMLKQLIMAGFPVIVEIGFMPEGYDWMGHYRLLIAYDDQLREVYSYDSFLGHGNLQGLPTSYDLFDDRWQHFNRPYIVLYEQAREAELRQVLGEHADLTANYQHALDVARQEANLAPDNPYAWFNMGTSYLKLGMFQEAAQAYDQARNAGSGLPWRMLWYQFGPYQAYYEVGRYDDVMALAQATLGTTTYVEETFYWKGMVFMAREDYASARSQFNLALQHNRNFLPAQDALVQLQIAEDATTSNQG